jgi:hypothetical protein
MKTKSKKQLLSQAAAILGSMTSEKKKKSSRANGRLGGHWSRFVKPTEGKK